MQLPAFLTQDAAGEIRLTGHRIGLYTVVRCHKEGRTAEQLAAEYPSLPLDLVQRVIAYYRANQTETDRYVETYRIEVERQAAQPPGPGVLKIRRCLELIREADELHKEDPEWINLSVVEKLRRIEQAHAPEPA